MICVIASFPSKQNEQDGMIQRVVHIDTLMASTPRTYLDVSFRRFLRKQTRTENSATIYCVNVFAHFFFIWKLLRAARIVYIHSAYNALRIMAFPTSARIIFDAHGAVPEELTQEGRKGAAQILGVAERFILRRCDILVCVTRAMLEHFNRKHGPRANRAELVLPILPRFGETADAANALQSFRNTDSVIYAGGMQIWQNVDLMVEAASHRRELLYTFLTGDVAAFEAKLRDGGVNTFVCTKVKPAQVKDHYLTHNYGFVLRDEILVNQVACPTKLMEYLYWGVLPIVITPNIGDFNAQNLRGVTLEQFRAGLLPDADAAESMRRHNQSTVLALIDAAQANQDRLQDQLLDGG